MGLSHRTSILQLHSRTELLSCHSNWVRDSHERQTTRVGDTELDTDPQRSPEKFKLSPENDTVQGSGCLAFRGRWV